MKSGDSTLRTKFLVTGRPVLLAEAVLLLALPEWVAHWEAADAAFADAEQQGP